MQFGKGILPAKEYLSNGLFSIQNCYSEAESSFNQQLHFHDFYELSLIYEGSSRFLINGSSFVAAAGSLQLIRPSDYHRQMTDTGEYIRYYNLIFRQEVLSNVLLDALEEAVEPFCFQMQEKEMQKMTQLLLELKREQEEKEVNKEDVLHEIKSLNDILKNPDVSYEEKGTLTRTIVDQIVYDKESGKMYLDIIVS